MACGITSAAPVTPAIASRRVSTLRHQEKSGSASRSRLIARPAMRVVSRIRCARESGQVLIDDFREFFQTSFTRIEWPVLKIDKRGHIERLLVGKAALFALWHVGPNKSSESLDIVESCPRVVGVQAPCRRDRAVPLRSEERRVGKEGRSRGGP